MKGKVRPVGNRVPQASACRNCRTLFPWQKNYHTQFMGSGTEALAAAVALASSRRPELTQPTVVIPAYGCPDLVAAVVASGARPVLVDTDKDSPFMNEKALGLAIKESTVAVIAVGFLGMPEDLRRISELCNDKNLVLIEDSAQCFPPISTDNQFADFVVLSFGRGKPINLMGGGALLIRREHFESSEHVLQSYPKKVFNIGVGWHTKRLIFNLLLGRILYSVLERLPFLGIGETRFIKLNGVTRLDIPAGLVSAGEERFYAQAETSAHYRKALAWMEESGWILLPETQREKSAGESQGPLLRYGLLAPTSADRDRALKELNDRGIGASAFYGKSLTHIDGIAAEVCSDGEPNACDFAGRLLTLPTHEDVTLNDVARAALVLRKLA